MMSTVCEVSRDSSVNRPRGMSMPQRTSIPLPVSYTRPSLKSYLSGPFPALVTVVGMIHDCPGFDENSVVSASATKSNT